MHVDDPGHEQRTTAAFIAELPTSAVKVRQRARMWVTIGSPCSSIKVPVMVGEALGDVPRWERFAQLHPGHRPALDELEAWLAGEELPAADAWVEVDSLLLSLGR